MKTCDVVVNVKNDKDARPIALLVQTASQFDSKVYIDSEDKHVNAKSIMGMMTLSLINGSKVTVSADGEDEEEACERMQAFLTSR
ncbi:MAG: HPr family phosphocarrier protein [Lachnospiraceae bacterium]|nr:HPr family phosphocarrier protein [Lachnospiraceae bacterium]